MTKDKSDLDELSPEAKELLKLLLNMPAWRRKITVNFMKDANDSMRGTPIN